MSYINCILNVGRRSKRIMKIISHDTVAGLRLWGNV